MGALMRQIEWGNTPLGQVASWPQSLRTAISMMLEARFAMVIAWGPEFRFFYNDRYIPVLGTKHPHALGTPAAEIFPEIWELIGPEFQRVSRGESFALDDWYLPLARSGYRENCWFTVSYSPIRDETGGVGGLLAVVAETTGRVESERRLATLRELAGHAAEARAPDQACRSAALALARNPIDVPFAVLYTVDDDGRTARRLAHPGLPDDHPAAPATVALHPGAPGGWPLAAVATGGVPLVVDDLPARFGELPGGPAPEPSHAAIVLPLARPGLAHPYGVLVAGISPRRALDDRYRGFFELAADHIATAIGNARSLDEQRRRAEALAELDRAKTAFFSNVSHEFRTPLALMLGPLDDLLAGRHGPVTPEIHAQHELVHRNALRLHKLVNAMLDFSRIEAGRARATYEPTDLAALTAETAGMFRAAIERAGLALLVDCPPLPEPVFVDREMWEKIVLNLLSNAFKFTFHGSISVTLRPAGEFVELAVRDTGCGIPANELPRVFERFHRIEQARSRTHEGTGIGLALALELARLHGGAIHATSEPGAGSQFTVRIRSGRAHLPPDHIAAAPRAADTRARAYVEEALRWLPDPEPQSADATESPPADTQTGAPRAAVQTTSPHDGRAGASHADIEAAPPHDGRADAPRAVAADAPSAAVADAPSADIRAAPPRADIHAAAPHATTAAQPAPAGAPPDASRAGRAAALRRGSSDVLRPARAEPTRPGGSSRPVDAPALPRPRVLIADDNADMRDYLRRMLEPHWQITAVPDGAAALAAIRRDPPDLVVSDVMMPAIDGFALIAAVRRDPRTRDLPVIIVSARAGDEARAEGIEAGADDYLVKPFSARELIARVAGQLAAAAARRAGELQRRTLYALFEQVPAAIAVLGADTFAFEMVNRRFLATARPAGDLIGRRIFDAFPILRDRGFEPMLELVRRTGEPCAGSETEIGGRWWNFVLAPLASDRSGAVDRILSFSYEVTEQVIARQRAETAITDLQDTVSLLDATLSSVPVGLSYYDRDLRLVQINDTLVRWNGLDRERMIGRPVAEIMPPAAAQRVTRRLREVFATGTASETVPLATPTLAKPDEHRHWLVTYYPVLAPSGTIIQVGVVVVDVTREQRARAEAELQKQHLHGLFMQAPTPICILRGGRHIIELANEACCDVWHRDHADLIGRPLLDAVPELASDGFRALLDRVFTTGEPQIGKEVRTDVRGDETYFNFTYTAMRSVDGAIEGTLVIASDVTDEVRARREQARTIEYNEKFTAMLGHDLHNPLNAIVTAAELLQRRAIAPEILRPATRIVRSAERMSRMIAQLLDLARVRVGGGLRVAPRQLALGELCQHVLDELRQANPSCRLTLTATGPVQGQWDGDRLAQVISNLAGNALEHGAPGEPVTVELDGCDPDRVAIRVANSGAIAEDVLPTLFEPFRGVHQRREHTRGLGLGLYISREIVVAHGGTITVASSASEGTRFEIVLPRVAGALE